MSAYEKRYTDCWLRFAGWTVARALLRSAAASSGLFGSQLLPTAAVGAVDEGFPALTWWRTGARAGIAAAEAFANDGTSSSGEPGTAPAREQPSADGVG
jgi:hypothetical protein